jgi:hypothetical protein
MADTNSQRLKFIGKKTDGVSLGGIYEDSTNPGQRIMVKSGEFKEGVGNEVISEALASKLFGGILGFCTADIDIIDSRKEGLPESKNPERVTSKFIKGFETIQEFIELDEDNPILKKQHFKDIKGFQDVMAASLFFADGDAHKGNVGIITLDSGEKYFAKIDHGAALGFNGNSKEAMGSPKEILNGNIAVTYKDRFGTFEAAFLGEEFAVACENIAQKANPQHIHYQMNVSIDKVKTIVSDNKDIFETIKIAQRSGVDDKQISKGLITAINDYILIADISEDKSKNFKLLTEELRSSSTPINFKALMDKFGINFNEDEKLLTTGNDKLFDQYSQSVCSKLNERKADMQDLADTVRIQVAVREGNLEGFKDLISAKPEFLDGKKIWILEKDPETARDIPKTLGELVESQPNLSAEQKKDFLKAIEVEKTYQLEPKLEAQSKSGKTPQTIEEVHEALCGVVIKHVGDKSTHKTRSDMKKEMMEILKPNFAEGTLKHYESQIDSVCNKPVEKAQTKSVITRLLEYISPEYKKANEQAKFNEALKEFSPELASALVGMKSLEKDNSSKSKVAPWAPTAKPQDIDKGSQSR